MIMHESLPATRDAIVSIMAQEEVFNLVAYLDAEEMRVVMVARDLIDYCRGDVEGTDLQLNDSRDLPVAQAIAEEEIALERGMDEDGLAFAAEDARFHRVPRPGDQPRPELERMMEDWAHALNITLQPAGSPD